MDIKMTKNISDLLKQEDKMNSKAQQVEDYSSNTVIECLKKSLNIHWQQTTALTAQATHLERWGYKKLAESIKADAEEEHGHAAVNIARLEFKKLPPLSISTSSVF